MPIPINNEARIETSTYCNAGCVFCPWPTDIFTRRNKIMSLEDYKYIIDKLLYEAWPTINEVTISGFGEAFTDPTIIEKIEYASYHNFGIHILTNGSLLNKEKIDRIFKANVMDLRFSLHTANPDSYGKVMNYANKNKNWFSIVQENIDYAIKNVPKNTEIIITADIVEENENDINELIAKYSKDCRLEIWKPHNWVDKKNYRNKNLPIIRNTCGRPFNGPIQIEVNGDVIMCCFDFNDEMVLGNFYKQTLEEIYSSSLYMKIAKHHTNGTCGSSNLLCKNCDQLRDNGEIVIYNSKMKPKDRIGRTTTNLKKLT